MVHALFLSKKGSRKTSQYGFNIIELTVIVTIAMILGSVSLIIFRNARTHYELAQNAQKFVWQIERARSLAVKYNQTLTLGFTSSNTVFGLTCSCSEPKNELSTLSVPTGITLSAYPTLTIKGNGTIQSTNGTFIVSDGRGYQVTITISNSGRTTAGEVIKVSN
jgi:type II secretory pathway pseudopilin PulG